MARQPQIRGLPPELKDELARYDPYVRRLALCLAAHNPVGAFSAFHDALREYNHTLADSVRERHIADCGFPQRLIHTLESAGYTKVVDLLRIDTEGLMSKASVGHGQIGDLIAGVVQNWIETDDV